MLNLFGNLHTTSAYGKFISLLPPLFTCELNPFLTPSPRAIFSPFIQLPDIWASTVQQLGRGALLPVSFQRNILTIRENINNWNDRFYILEKKGSNCCQLNVIVTWPPALKDKTVTTDLVTQAYKVINLKYKSQICEDTLLTRFYKRHCFIKDAFLKGQNVPIHIVKGHVKYAWILRAVVHLQAPNSRHNHSCSWQGFNQQNKQTFKHARLQEF